MKFNFYMVAEMAHTVIGISFINLPTNLVSIQAYSCRPAVLEISITHTQTDKTNYSNFAAHAYPGILMVKVVSHT